MNGGGAIFFYFCASIRILVYAPTDFWLQTYLSRAPQVGQGLPRGSCSSFPLLPLLTRKRRPSECSRGNKPSETDLPTSRGTPDFQLRTLFHRKCLPVAQGTAVDGQHIHTGRFFSKAEAHLSAFLSAVQRRTPRRRGERGHTAFFLLFFYFIIDRSHLYLCLTAVPNLCKY